MEVDKEVYENNEVRLEIQEWPGGNTTFWLQIGINGLYVRPEELADMYELIGAYISEVGNETD